MIEILLVLACIWFAAWLRFYSTPEEHLDYMADLPLRAALIAICLIGAMFSFGLYQPHVRQGRFDFALRLFASFIFGGVLLTVLYYLLPFLYVGRGVLSLSLLLSLCAIVIVREIHEKLATSDLMKQRLLVYGAGENAELINQHMRRASDRRAFFIVGFVPVPGQRKSVEQSKLLEATTNLLELAISLNIDEIVMAADERRGAIPMEDMLACVQRGIVVIPKLVHKNRMAENFDVFDFELNDTDMKLIASLDKNESQFFDHRDPNAIESIFGASLRALKN